MMDENTLAFWTVYDHPSDYSGKFVARRFDIGGWRIDTGRNWHCAYRRRS